MKYNGNLTTNQKILKAVNVTGQVLLAEQVTKADLLTGYNLDIAKFPTRVYMGRGL